MNWKRTILRNMTALMLSGVLLSPFVLSANELGSHGGQTIGNVGGHQTMNSNGNDTFGSGMAGRSGDFVDHESHMGNIDQVHNDLDMTNIVMDGDHMTGSSAHSGESHGYGTIETNDSYNHQRRSSRVGNYRSHGGMMNGMH